MTNCSCHYALLEHLHIGDLAKIVEEYVHRKHIILPRKVAVSGRDVSITMNQIENGYSLRFMVKKSDFADQKWYNVGSHSFKNVPVNVVAHNMFTPKSWLQISATLWDDQHLWAEYRLKFKRTIQKIRKRLRKEYERYAHELVVEYLQTYAYTYAANFLNILSGITALQYS